jgi:Trk/Ktr/HKT type cation transporter
VYIREQLSLDIGHVFLGVFLICIIESSQIQNTDEPVRHLPDALTFQWFNIFNVMFEVVSAYACVGLSIVCKEGNYVDGRDIPLSMRPSHRNFIRSVSWLSWP